MGEGIREENLLKTFIITPPKLHLGCPSVSSLVLL